MITPSLDEIAWFHRVPLRDGRITPGRSDMAANESKYLFDRLDFRGRSVLDIGAWDGYFSFMAEQRGASRVLSLDDPAFRWGGLDGYRFLHQHFESRAEWRRGSIYELPDERFDIVLCYGVLYHLNDPLTALINALRITRHEIVIEGVIFEHAEPLLWLFAPREHHGDPTNLYAMSTGYLLKAARLCGFELVEIKYPRYAATRWRRWKRKLRPGHDRAAMWFRRVDERLPGYQASCFSLPPTKLGAV
ncbi:DUF1698 domain-containing protein [Piscinibacter sakaiensis]|uniref:Methyltransferase type 11 n=1 Tax=Piscinibacter sakaiensis TaxID=1547922 RepID=A0A0K8P6E8_PISS1|nr:DUF1698 domain-containing protein [Piscinibacter sakaiensis]GAP38278.1 methyltransferase type 11 [Piscinibacter sakaiensis]